MTFLLSSLAFFISFFALSVQPCDYTEKTALVRVSDSVCSQQENAFIKKRHHFVKATLEKLTGLTLTDQEVPRIALCCSGGGYRALIGTLGYLNALDKATKSAPANKAPPQGFFSTALHIIRTSLSKLQASLRNFFFPVTPITNPHISSETSLIQCFFYMGCVSGSSWAICGWLHSGLSCQQYLSHLRTRLERGLLSDISTRHLIRILKSHKKTYNTVSILNLFSALLAEQLFKIPTDKDPHTIDITHLCQDMHTGIIPMPIFTAVIDHDSNNQRWVEFTPFEVGCKELRGFIPLWSFGRSFYEGASLNCTPPVLLEFCLGLWGSAMAANLGEICAELERKQGFFNEKIVPNVIKPFLNSIHTTMQYFGSSRTPFNFRAVSPQIPNWTYGISGAPLEKVKNITVVDAGVSLDLALPPLLEEERAVDIIVVLDMTLNKPGIALLDAAAYATEKNLPFPTLNSDTFNQPVSIHGNVKDIDNPVIIYIPLLANKEYEHGWDPRQASCTSMFNFKYAPQEVDLLAGLTEYTMLSKGNDAIINTVRNWILAQR